MMKELKFRAWDKQSKVMREVEIINFDLEGVTCWDWNTHECIDLSFDEIELMQYTGVNDKNGMEIYTGFFVRWGLRTYKICFDCGFYMHDLSKINPDYPITKEFKNASDEFEIVGNIYENPNLEIK